MLRPHHQVLRYSSEIDLLPGADNSLGNSLMPYVAIEQKYLLVVISDDKGNRVSFSTRWGGGENPAVDAHHKHCKQIISLHPAI